MNLKRISFILLISIFILFISSVSAVDAVNLDDNMDLDESSRNFITSDSNMGKVTPQDEISDNVSTSYVVEHDGGIEKDSNNDIIKNVNVSLSGNDINLNLTINRTSNNSVDVKMSNTTLKVYQLYVSDLKSYNDAMDFISRKDIHYDSIIIDFKHDLTLNFKNLHPFKPGSVKNIIMRGNGVKFDGVRNDYLTWEKIPIQFSKYFVVEPEYSLILKDLTITGFYTPIFNKGKTTIDHVILDSNLGAGYNKGKFALGNGGAIFNQGVLECRDSVFSNNGALLGGAVYNDKNSNTIIIDCKFSGNWARDKIAETIGSDYHVSDFMIRANDLNNIYTDDLAHCAFFDNDAKFMILNIKNYNDFRKALICAKQLGHLHNLCLNFTNGVYEIPNDFEGINLEYIENLYIKGNGAQFKVKNSDSSKNCHFLNLLKHRNSIIKNITLEGFNKAIINKGSLTIQNSLFNKNKCDYYFAEDYGASIYNHKSGVLYLNGTTFSGGYAKYGGAIYNDHGQMIYNNCIFKSNTAYGDGGAIYNDHGQMIYNNCIFKSNTAYGDGGAIYNEYAYMKFIKCSIIDNFAKSNGGGIFNHYGSIVSDDDQFEKCVATKLGGAIYNDFGMVVLYNDTFINPAKDFLYNYGKEAKIVSYNSSQIHYMKDGVKIQNLTVVNDAPNENLRTAVRFIEAGAAIVIGGLLVLSPFKGATLTVVSFAVGVLLAAGEEIFEECYLDHNFNFVNCLAMSIEAGIIDATCIHAFDFVASKLTKIFPRFTKILVFGLETTEEILTEFIPRCDLTDDEYDNIPLNDNYEDNASDYSKSPVLSTNYIKAFLFGVPVGFTLNLYNDYIVGPSPVEINQNSVTIDGQGHTIKFTQDGGYIFTSTSGSVVLKNLIIDGNGHHGGVVNNGGHYTLENCTIRNFVLKVPTATFSGYAVLNSGSACTSHFILKNCFIDNNKAFMGDTKISNGKSKGECYIIYSNNIDVDNCIFTNNRAKIGGAIYCLNNANINNSKFVNNEADKAAAAIFANKITVNNSLFKSNKALLKEAFIEDRQDVDRKDYGGAITATGDIFVSNSMFENNHASKNGGAINTKGSATLINVVFSKNDALIDGGAVYSFNNVFANNCTFTSNKADGSKNHECWGGAIRALGDAKVKYCNFINNYAENSGGAIYAKTVTFLSTPCLFKGNTAYKDKGGAIYTDKFTNDVKYAVFINNAASKTGISDDGGAIYVNSENHITFSNCIFINNHCSDEGGAIYFDSCKSHVKLYDNIFINNGAKDEGQDIFNKGYYDVIKHNYWSKNPTKNNDQLVEWKSNPFVKNVHHSDSSTLKLDYDITGVLKNNELKINEFVSYVFKYVFKLNFECNIFH